MAPLQRASTPTAEPPHERAAVNVEVFHVKPPNPTRATVLAGRESSPVPGLPPGTTTGSNAWAARPPQGTTAARSSTDDLNGHHGGLQRVNTDFTAFPYTCRLSPLSTLTTGGTIPGEAAAAASTKLPGTRRGRWGPERRSPAASL
jgi:hypothetical protein